jgi:hypothetical protein
MEYLRKWVLFLILGTFIGTLLIGPVSASGFGDYVWYDTNCDGIQNDGHWLDVGTPEVTVDLYRNSDNVKLATLITRQYDPIIQPDFPNGYYFFYSYLIPGLDQINPTNVYVKFTPPSGYTFSPMNVGVDNELDSDVDPNTHKTTSFVMPLATQDNSKDAGLCKKPPFAEGRMTGGGSVFTVDNTRVTRGFEIHCDLSEPNNIEVNWPGGNNFHLLDLTSAVCTEDPNIIQEPPAAPFDTFNGEGTGKLNGVPGAPIQFVFVDAGEPGKSDTAMIQIWDVGATPGVDTPVLSVSGYLKKGNIQAHDDKP